MSGRRKSHDLLAAILGLALIAAIVAGFLIVGNTQARDEVEGFDWELASIFGTAVGTTLLAIVTGVLAWSTRTEVGATQDLAELTREDQAARERSIVIVLDRRVRRFRIEDGAAVCELHATVVNAGLGPALNLRYQADYVGKNGRLDSNVTFVPIPLLEPRERQDLTFVFSGPAESAPAGTPGLADFKVTGTYRGRARKDTYEIEPLTG